MSEIGAEKENLAGIRLMAAVAAVLLIFSVAVLCIQAIAFDHDFYKNEYKKMNTAAYVGVSGESLGMATDTLLDYLEDKTPTLDLQVQVNGQDEEYYNEREKAHMVDVKALYQKALQFMAIGFCVGGGLLALCFALKRKRAAGPVLQAYFWAAVGVLAFFAVIGCVAAADFNYFWVSFHHVFFTNDLRMLDPATSRMIRMFEQDFFADMVAKILAWFLAVTCGTAAAAGIGYQRMKKHGRR